MSSTATTALRASRSPSFSDTLSGHLFMTNVIPHVGIVTQPPLTSTSPNSTDLAPQPCVNARVRKSLEELSQEIRELEDFITVSEDVMRRERERDREFYERERGRRKQETAAYNNNNKENRSPKTCPIYSLQSPTYKRGYHVTLRKCKSANSGAGASSNRISIRKGRLGSAPTTSGNEVRDSRSGQDTQELIKSIIRMRNDSVSPADADILPSEFGFGHSFLDASVSPNTIGKELESNKDSLEMIVIDCAPDQSSMVCGNVVGDGEGVDLTQNPTPPTVSTIQPNET